MNRPPAPNPNVEPRRVRNDHDEPRLPFERDVSADSQTGPTPPSDAPIEQARRDVEGGLVDTDEGRRRGVGEIPLRQGPRHPAADDDQRTEDPG